MAAREFDHVVVGGGPVGAATALWLSGAFPDLHETAASARRSPASTTTTTTAALVFDPQDEAAHGDASRLARLSFDAGEGEAGEAAFQASQESIKALDALDAAARHRSWPPVVPIRPGVVFLASPGTPLAEALAASPHAEKEGGLNEVSKAASGAAEMTTDALAAAVAAALPGASPLRPPAGTRVWTHPTGYVVDPRALSQTMRRLAAEAGVELIEGRVAQVTPEKVSLVCRGGSNGGTGPSSGSGEEEEEEAAAAAAPAARAASAVPHAALLLARRHVALFAGAQSKDLLSDDDARTSALDTTTVAGITAARLGWVKDAQPAAVFPVVLGQLRNIPGVPWEVADFSMMSEEGGKVVKLRLSGAPGSEVVSKVADIAAGRLPATGSANSLEDSELGKVYIALMRTLCPTLNTTAPVVRGLQRCVTYRNSQAALSSGRVLVAAHGGRLLTTPACGGVGIRFGPLLGRAAANHMQDATDSSPLAGIDVIDAATLVAPPAAGPASPTAAATPGATFRLVQHDGAVVAAVVGPEAGTLVNQLRLAGAEVLDPEAGSPHSSFIVYTKQYDAQEQEQRDGGHGFDRGMSLENLFRRYPHVPVDAASAAELGPFLTAEEQRALEASATTAE